MGSRGGFDLDDIMDFLQTHDVRHLCVSAGTARECVRRNVKVSIAGIPKTIDDGVDYIDCSFGFLLVVEAAQASIR